MEHLVHPLARRLVPRPEQREQLEQLDLDPRCGHAMVVVVARQTVLRDLLQDRHVARDEVFERLHVLLRQLV